MVRANRRALPEELVERDTRFQLRVPVHAAVIGVEHRACPALLLQLNERNLVKGLKDRQAFKTSTTMTMLNWMFAMIAVRLATT